MRVAIRNGRRGTGFFDENVAGVFHGIQEE
jgi:hypothetical protein